MKISVPSVKPAVYKFTLLTLAALTLAGCGALQSIDKGLYNVAEAVSERDRITGRRTLSSANRSEQIAQGNAFVNKYLAAERKAGRKLNGELNSAMHQRLVAVFDRIHQVSHLRNERWQPILVDKDSFNAFTTGGTYIVVHDGLMRDVKSDDELAAVIGHEIAHTVANHVFERRTHQMATLLTHSGSARRQGYQAAFTHEAEIEADKVGILYAALAGFDPYAASRIWQRQYKKQGSARGLFFHDHPVNSERAENTRRIASQVRSYYRKGQRNPSYVALLQNNALWRKRASSAAPGSGGGLSAVMTTLLGAYVTHEETKHEAARQAQQMQLMRALGKNITVLGQRNINAQRWQVTWQNRNSVKLKSVVMGVLIKNRQGKVRRYVTHIPDVVGVGQRFTGQFTLPELTTADLRPRQISYYLDDAVPYR